MQGSACAYCLARCWKDSYCVRYPCSSMVLRACPRGGASSSSPDQRGFTLIELVMVLVLAGVLAVFAAPRLFSTGDFNARGFQDETLSLLRYAQKAAIAQRRTVCVTFCRYQWREFDYCVRAFNLYLQYTLERPKRRQPGNHHRQARRGLQRRADKLQLRWSGASGQHLGGPGCDPNHPGNQRRQRHHG